MWTLVSKHTDSLLLDNPADELDHGYIDGPAKIENGLYVYEVIDQAGVEVRRSANFKGGENRSGQVLRFGDTFSANQKVSYQGRDTFVRLDDGTGWLFESKRGVPCLRSLPVEYGLFVYRVQCQPSMPFLRRPDMAASPPDVTSHLQETVVTCGELVAANARVVSGYALVGAGRQTKRSRFIRVMHKGAWMCELHDGTRYLKRIKPREHAVAAPTQPGEPAAVPTLCPMALDCNVDTPSASTLNPSIIPEASPSPQALFPPTPPPHSAAPATRAGARLPYALEQTARIAGPTTPLALSGTPHAAQEAQMRARVAQAFDRAMAKEAAAAAPALPRRAARTAQAPPPPPAAAATSTAAPHDHPRDVMSATAAVIHACRTGGVAGPPARKKRPAKPATVKAAAKPAVAKPRRGKAVGVTVGVAPRLQTAERRAAPAPAPAPPRATQPAAAKCSAYEAAALQAPVGPPAAHNLACPTSSPAPHTPPQRQQPPAERATSGLAAGSSGYISMPSAGHGRIRDPPPAAANAAVAADRVSRNPAPLSNDRAGDTGGMAARVAWAAVSPGASESSQEEGDSPGARLAEAETSHSSGAMMCRPTATASNSGRTTQRVRALVHSCERVLTELQHGPGLVPTEDRATGMSDFGDQLSMITYIGDKNEEQLCERMQKLEAEAAKIAQKHADTQRELARKMRLRKETYESKMGEIYRKKFWTSGEAVVAYPPTESRPASVAGIALEGKENQFSPDAEALFQQRLQTRGNAGAWRLTRDPRYHVAFGGDYEDYTSANVALANGYLIVHDDGGCSHWEIPVLLANRLAEAQGRLKVRYATLGPSGRYYVQFTNGTAEWVGPPGFTEAVNECATTVQRVAFGPENGWFVLCKGGGAVWNNIPRRLHKQITKRADENVQLADVALGPKGEWFVLYEDGAWKVAGIPDTLAKKIDEIHAGGSKIKNMAFGAEDSWFVRYYDEVKQKLMAKSSWP